FTATATASKAIGTVGIVEWTTSLGKVDSAQIEFSLVSPKTNEINLGGVAPVDVAKPNYRTLMLGLKGARDYKYHIVATGGGTKCTSQDFTFKSGAVANSVPTLTRQLTNAAGRARGFILTSAGIGGGFGTGSSAPAFIIDSDGDVVWW